MKVPNLYEKAYLTIPESYTLNLSELCDMIKQSKAAPSDPLLFALIGAYQWGFERGRSCEKRKAKAEGATEGKRA